MEGTHGESMGTKKMEKRGGRKMAWDGLGGRKFGNGQTNKEPVNRGEMAWTDGAGKGSRDKEDNERGNGTGGRFGV